MRHPLPEVRAGGELLSDGPAAHPLQPAYRGAHHRDPRTAVLEVQLHRSADHRHLRDPDLRITGVPIRYRQRSHQLRRSGQDICPQRHRHLLRRLAGKNLTETDRRSSQSPSNRKPVHRSRQHKRYNRIVDRKQARFVNNVSQRVTS